MSSVIIAVVVVLMALETTAQSETDPSCPQIKCAANCYSVTGDDGCPSYCKCPCQTVRCSAGHECQLVEVQCVKAPCYPVAECVPTEATKPPCPQIKCARNCYSVTGDDGCPSHCECPCQTIKCSAGYACQLVDVQCKKAPCYPVGRCVKTTECPPQDPCNIRCSTPLQTDENGCQLCQCSAP